MDNAFWLWTFQGRLLQKNSKERFCQLLWRPRPPSLLPQEQIKVRRGQMEGHSHFPVKQSQINPALHFEIHSSLRRTWRNTPRSSSKKIVSVSPRHQRYEIDLLLFFPRMHTVFICGSNSNECFVLHRNWWTRDVPWWRIITSTVRVP